MPSKYDFDRTFSVNISVHLIPIFCKTYRNKVYVSGNAIILFPLIINTVG